MVKHIVAGTDLLNAYSLIFMEDYLQRLDRPEMTYYRETYKNSNRWTGEPLDGKTLIIYCEQGLGDTLQFARYFGGCDGARIILHCAKPLHRLFLAQENAPAQVLDKDDPSLPPHDYHVLSMSLPFILKGFNPQVPYIKVPPLKLDEESSLPEKHRHSKKIGVCWEGSPEHPQNLERSCPLRHFQGLVKPGRSFWMLQKEVQLPQLTRGAELLDLLGSEVNDLYDLAKLVASMDIVVSVDTAVLHLAGAMGKMTFGLLAKDYDYRWKVKNWYPTVAFLFQGKQGDWLPVFAGAMMLVDTTLSSTVQREPAEIATMLGESFLS